MKPLLCWLLFYCFFTGSIDAQVNSPVVYTNMPENGIDLTHGWKFSPKDSLVFSRPDFNDLTWDTISPTKSLYRLPQLKQVKTGWLRLHFKIGPALGGRTLLLSAWQNCASEIYLDGKLIKRYGSLGSDSSDLVPLGINQPSEELHLVPGKEYVLAVRFAVWKGAFLLKNGGYFCWLSLTDLPLYEKANHDTAISSAYYMLLFSVFFLLSLLHLAFYRYDPVQRANLFFALYAIFTAVGFACVNLQGYVNDARAYALVYMPAFLLTLMGGIWIVRALGGLFGFPIRKLVTGLWIIFAVCSLLIIRYRIAPPFFTGIIIFALAQLWLTAKAIKARKRGVGIIATGFMVSIVLALLLAVVSFSGGQLSDYLYEFTTSVVFLSPALGISLYLAREFALDSRLLREKLIEVEALSKQNIIQEQEKQHLLARQNDELEKQVSQRTVELQNSFNDLRSTQAQLIQAEKMASLGELTAGIAHEIQNPLNFVNNFSEVSVELIEELNEELDKGEFVEAKAIATDIKQNLEKIHYHGTRADSIVKGMLEHSRASTGQKELTDLNKLADEYMRLAYHGLRAKDKSFNAELITRFDESLPLVSIIPQDIGRVLLNLFTNAFYATQQKAKTAGTDYKPLVELNTAIMGDFIEVSVKDNGTGIPNTIKDKIMQPFFTTKPTGVGTGLGLSISYDIIVKTHNGKIEIDSHEGEGAEFTITLPTT